MSDKGPAPAHGEKQGKTIKEKRADKRDKANPAASIDPVSRAAKRSGGHQGRRRRTGPRSRVGSWLSWRGMPCRERADVGEGEADHRCDARERPPVLVRPVMS